LIERERAGRGTADRPGARGAGGDVGVSDFERPLYNKYSGVERDER
jgi:hypothetical protein